MGVSEDTADNLGRIANALEELVAMFRQSRNNEQLEVVRLNEYTLQVNGRLFRSIGGLKAFAGKQSRSATKAWHCLVKLLPTDNTEHHVLVDGDRPLPTPQYRRLQASFSHTELIEAESWYIDEGLIQQFLQIAGPGNPRGYGPKSGSLLEAWLAQ